MRGCWQCCYAATAHHAIAHLIVLNAAGVLGMDLKPPAQSGPMDTTKTEKSVVVGPYTLDAPKLM